MNISDEIRINAFQYVEQGKIQELNTLIIRNPSLVTVQSKRDGGTLFIRACEYLKKDIIQLLLSKGADPKTTNFYGNNGIHYLFYRHNISNIEDRDRVALEILELLKEKNISIDCFITKDKDLDTPFIEAVRAKLPRSTSFLLELLTIKGLLKTELMHLNKSNHNILQIALQKKFFHYGLIEKVLSLYTHNDATKLIVDAAVKCSSPSTEEKNVLLSLVKEYLGKNNSQEIRNLANIIFQQNLYEENVGNDTTFHGKNLKNEYASGDFGVNIFNSLDVELIELLYVVGGINLYDFTDFVNTLPSIKEQDIQGPCFAVVFEHNKHKILQTIESSNILDQILKGSIPQFTDQNVVITKDLALKRVCFLLANKDNIKISDKSEIGKLLKFINFSNNIKGYHYNIYDNFKTYLIKECKTYDNFKRVLDFNSFRISQIIKSEDKLISKLKELALFKDRVDVLTIEIEKLLNAELIDVLPSRNFISLFSNTNEETIDKTTREWIESNLTFFTPPSTIQVPEYDKLENTVFKNSIKYYRNNPISLVPYARLLQISNNQEIMGTLRNSINNYYNTTEATIEKSLNVIINGYKYITSLEEMRLDTTLDRKNLQEDKLPILKESIKEVLYTPELSLVKNIADLCTEISCFLRIAPIHSLFKEYHEKYQALELKVDKTKKLLNEIGITWNDEVRIPNISFRERVALPTEQYENRYQLC